MPHHAASAVSMNARLAAGNEGAGGSIGRREFGRWACRFPRGRMRLYEKCEEDEHNCGAQAREEDRPLNLTQIEHGYSRTSKYQRTMAAQNGTPNASQAPGADSFEVRSTPYDTPRNSWPHASPFYQSKLCIVRINLTI